MSNIFEDAKKIEEIKNKLDEMKSLPVYPSITNNTTKQKDIYKPTYSPKAKELFKALQLNKQEENTGMQRPEKTIGKETQRKGKGRGCM